MPRVLLIEFITTDRFHRSIPFPFVHGYLRGRGVTCRWLRFGHPATWRADASGTGYGLPSDEASHLLDICRDLVPTHLLWSTAPSAELAAQVRAATGVAAAAVLDGDQAECAAAAVAALGGDNLGSLAHFIGLAEDPASHTWGLMEHIAPDFGFEAANDGARSAPVLPFLMFGEECSYNRILDDNPYFAGIDTSRYGRGCSFCMRPAGHGAWQTAPLILARRQFEALARTLPPVAGRLPVRLTGALPVRHIESIAELLLDLNLPPLDLLLDARADVLVHSRQKLDHALTLLGPTSHKIHISLIGIESFVDRELQRLNKGTTWHENLGAAATLLELEHAHPQSFSFREHGGLSLLLFTPWTRLEDLAANLAIVSRAGLGDACGKRFTSRLRLYPALPLHALALRDGLLCEAYDDPWLDTARRNFYADESPWRFADPRVEPVSQLFLRLEPERDEDDALLQALQELDARAQSARDRGRLAELLVDVALAHAQPLPALMLLHEAERRLLQHAQAEQTSPAPPAVRRTVSPLTVMELRLGLKKVLRLEASLAATDQAAPLCPELPDLHWLPRDSAQGREWFGGSDKADLQQAIEWTQQLERVRSEQEQRDLIQKCGSLLGYPPCCTAAFAARPANWLHTYNYVHLLNRIATPGAVPWQVNAATQNFLDYVPCTLDCAATAERCRRITQEYRDASVAEIGDLEAAMRHPWLFGLDAESEALELVTQWDGQGNAIHFRPGIHNGSSELLRLAAQGDEVRFDEQELVVLRGGNVLVSLTARAFVWWHERALQVPFWQALLRVRYAEASKTVVEPVAVQPVEQGVPASVLADPPVTRAKSGIDPRLRTWAQLLQRSAPAAGFRITAVDVSHHGRMLLALQMADGTPLRLLLADLKTTPNAYVTAGPFAVMYPPDMRIDTKAKDRVVRLIAGSLERFLGAGNA